MCCAITVEHAVETHAIGWSYTSGMEICSACQLNYPARQLMMQLAESYPKSLSNIEPLSLIKHVNMYMLI